MTLADRFNLTIKEEPPEKPNSQKKEVKKIEKPSQFEEDLRNSFKDEVVEDESPEMAELYEKSTEARLKLDILKAEQLEYKIKQEQIKLERETGNLIEYEMAEYLFFGFMKKTNNQILTLIKKIEPDIKNLCQENQPDELLRELQRNIESIIKDIQNQQKKDVKDWKKSL